MTVAYHNTCKRYPFFFILSSILLKTPELCKRLRGFYCFLFQRAGSSPICLEMSTGLGGDAPLG